MLLNTLRSLSLWALLAGAASAQTVIPHHGGGSGGGGGTVTSVAAQGDGLVDSATPTSAITGSGTLTLTAKAQTANTVLGAATTTASWLAMPSCSSASNALIWTTGTGFGCNTISGGGSGTVNSGTSNQFAYYAGAGTAVSGLSLTGYVKGNGASAPTASATIPTSAITGQLPNNQLATQTANTLLGALTATTPSGLAVPDCHGATNALIWTAGTGFTCNTIAAGGVGTVTSVATGTGLTGGPVTTTGTISLASQTANTVMGSLTAVAPSGLAVPSCSTSTSALYWTSGSGFGCHTITPGTGTVTSITAGTNLTGGTITTTGTIAVSATPSFTTVNGNTFTTGTYTLTGAAGKTLTFNNTLTLSGTDGTTMTFPSSNASLAALGLAQTWTGAQTFGETIAGENSQSGTTYTLAASDCGKLVLFTSGSAITLTTLNSLPIGCTIAVEQGGAGQITVSNGSGATLSSAHSYTKTYGQYAIIGLTVDTNSGGAAAHLVLTGDGA